MVKTWYNLFVNHFLQNPQAHTPLGETTLINKEDKKMANKYTSIEDLMKDSVKVYDGMVAVWPQYGTEEKVNFDCATFNGEKVYSSNNGTLAFIIDGTLYVTPSTRNAFRVLDEENFVEKYFYVPFSNGDFPKREWYIWQELRTRANQSHYEEFLEDCADYCDKHGIGALDESFLNNAFEIPRSGVRIIHLGYEDTIFPIITSNLLDSYAEDKLGSYCTNNGRVVFITRDGKTFVTKGYKILDILREAGFREKGIFVPFSNGEKILDPVLAEKWKQVKK